MTRWCTLQYKPALWFEKLSSVFLCWASCSGDICYSCCITCTGSWV